MGDDRTKWEQLVEVLGAAKVDATKFYEKNNRSAGARLRKSLQEVRKLAKECRAETLALTKAPVE